MSGIFGILNLDGQPVAREALQAMRDHMAHGDPAETSLWHVGHVGLGHSALFNASSASGESFPLRDSVSGIVLTAHARIDNYDELTADGGWQIAGGDHQPSARSHQPSAISDAELILHAYNQWGEECVKHLIGDWAFALWDPREHKLFLARDHHGISAIYYYHHPRFFAFASYIKGLLVLRDIPQKPNLLRVAQVLTSWPGDGIQTAYSEIFRLPPAHTLTIIAGEAEVRRYWYPGNLTPLRFSSDAEYVEAFLEIYTTAVQCRLRSPLSLEGKGRQVGATLSSGLDSGSVCALAARELRARDEPLPVFTSIPIYDTEGAVSSGRYGDESPLVEANRHFIGSLDVHYIRAENISPLAGIERTLDLHDEPGHAAANMFWIIALLQAAQQQGLGVLLTGQMGNAIISWMGGMTNLWPLILTGRWRAFWGKAQGLEPSLWKTVKRHLLRPVVQPVRDQIERQRYLGREPWAQYSAINLKFAQSLDLTRQMQADGHDPNFRSSDDPVQARLKIMQPGSSIVGALWTEYGAGYGLEVRDPTMDKRVIEFCLAIPDEQYRGNGQDRWLIRRALDGLLPDQVRLNTRRGLQAADLGYRILATLPEVQAMMARLNQSALAREVLDLPKMNRVLQALQKQVNVITTQQCVRILTRGLMAGMFLLRF